VGVILALVAGILEALIDLFPLQHLDRLELAFEQLGDQRVVERISLVLEIGIFTIAWWIGRRATGPCGVVMASTCSRIAAGCRPRRRGASGDSRTEG
jgi:hypothetical protein